MAHRFRFLATPITPATWEISGEEHHHLAKVLRLKIGDEVEVLDGAGTGGLGTLTEVTKKSATVMVEHPMSEPLRSSGCAIALGALKNAEVDECLPYLVELGVPSLHIFRQGHEGHFRISEANQSRWQRLLLSATKQCGSLRIPTLEIWTNLGMMLTAVRSRYAEVFYLDPDSPKMLEFTSTGINLGIVGSEAGFTSEEIALMQEAGFASYHLGTGRLRAKTAAITAAVICRQQS